MFKIFNLFFMMSDS